MKNNQLSKLIHKERTFISVKTDGIQRHLIGEIVSRFENRGLKMIACKMVVPTKEQIGQIYPDEDWWYENTGVNTIKGMESRGEKTTRTPLEIGHWVRKKLLHDLVGRPIVAMVWEGANAVRLGRKTIGDTDPLSAVPGTIRGDYTVESYETADILGHAVRNLVHASGSVEEAEKEIKVYFSEDEIIDYNLALEEILYGDGWGGAKKGGKS